jgi:hypothetical protein
MTPDNFSWKEFRHSIIIDSTIDRVFEFVSTSAGICDWFISECEYVSSDGIIKDKNEIAAEGDKFIWKWLNKDLKIEGKVLNSIIPERFEFTFGPMYEVCINLSEDETGVRVELNQKRKNVFSPVSETRDISNEDFNFLNCCVCWVFFLTNLKSVIEFGIDLREKNVRDEMLINQ